MRLVLNATYNTSVRDGIAHFIRRIAPPLSRLCELTVLTSDPDSYGSFCETRRIPKWANSGSGRLAWTMALRREHLLGECECLICPTPVAAPGLGVPILTVVHDLTPLVVRRSLPARTKFMFWTLMQSVRWADGIVVDSEHTRQDLIRLKLVREHCISVVPAGPGVEPSGLGGEGGLDLRPYVLYVGGHAVHKNLTRLITAFARVLRGSRLRLVLVGWREPALLARTEAAIRRNGVERQVVVLPGGLSDAQVSDLYRNCSLFIYPSLYEGFGLPVLEAMAHGVPVACSRSSSLPEVGGDAVLYFDPLSVDDIAAKMKRILDDARLESELRLRGHERARCFSWQRTAQGICDASLAAASSSCARRSRRTHSHPRHGTVAASHEV